nr:RHS repeat-associated core domain-containing protein [Neisseria zalophi]
MHSSDQRSGVTKFEYDRLGRITQADKETFAFDPAHNILSDGLKDKIADNRLKNYNGISYYYDDLGNLIHRELADGEVQNYFYDLHDQLVKVEIFKPEREKETWVYTYDALGRRTGKGRLKNGQEVSDGLEDKTDFTWDGSHLIQETRSDGLYTYIYTDKDAYEPLAQIRNWTNEEGESYQETNYFHCDQIGIPREMTDKDGNLLWFGKYKGWGKLEEETNIANAHQPFRLQNQYCDTETGLHYNFFRYYEPECGRFVNQDPIGLDGGFYLYVYTPNIQMWIDGLGLSPYYEMGSQQIYNSTSSIGWLGGADFKFHGNWCGPGWTGGHHESYSKDIDNNGYYKKPIGLLDSACKRHDMCYAECRELLACNGFAKKECMINCDDHLVNAAKNIQSDSSSFKVERDLLALAINQNMGIEGSCLKASP